MRGIGLVEYERIYWKSLSSQAKLEDEDERHQMSLAAPSPDSPRLVGSLTLTDERSQAAARPLQHSGLLHVKGGAKIE